jgi:hypothetical protein
MGPMGYATASTHMLRLNKLFREREKRANHAKVGIECIAGEGRGNKSRKEGEGEILVSGKLRTSCERASLHSLPHDQHGVDDAISTKQDACLCSSLSSLSTELFVCLPVADTRRVHRADLRRIPSPQAGGKHREDRRRRRRRAPCCAPGRILLGSGGIGVIIGLAVQSQ